MNCDPVRRSIALYIEDDLSVRERYSVEAHLSECSECRVFAEDLRESQAIFKSLKHDLPDGAALRFVRNRVRDGIVAAEAGPWFEQFVFSLLGTFRRKAALAGIALLAAGGAMWLSMMIQEEAVDVPGYAAAIPLPPMNPQIALVPGRPRIMERVPVPVQRVAPNATAAVEIVPAVEQRTVPRDLDTPNPDPPEQVAIKLLTDDPNVIIYWLVDSKGD